MEKPDKLFHTLQMITDELMFKSVISTLPVKSSQVDEFRNDRQMFAFLAAE
jgi:hypothetical protein